jgi:hypothetical protein
MKIVIDPFDSKSIREAIRKLERYEKEFKAKENEFVRRLKEIGVSVAETGFSMADYDGDNDVLIAETQNGPRAAIIAYGQAVGFIEFGTGVKFREYNSSSTEFTPPPHGSYGKGKGANPKGWYYNTANEGDAGRHTYGNPPAEAMLTARDVMVERVVQVAREVWK